MSIPFLRKVLKIFSRNLWKQSWMLPSDMKKIRKPETREYKIEFFKKTEYQNFKKEGFLIVRDQPEYNQLTVRIDSKDINTLFNKLTAYGVRLIAEVKYNLEKYFKTNLNIKGEKDNVQ